MSFLKPSLYSPVQPVPPGESDLPFLLLKSPWELSGKVKPVSRPDGYNPRIRWSPILLSLGTDDVQAGMIFSTYAACREYMVTHLKIKTMMVYRVKTKLELHNLMEYYRNNNIDAFVLNPPIDGGPTQVMKVDTDIHTEPMRKGSKQG